MPLRFFFTFLLLYLGTDSSATGFEAMRTVYPRTSETRFFQSGKPAFVVAVPKGRYEQQARAVIRALLGKEDDSLIIDASAEPPLGSMHVITLGCIAENPLLFRLYWNKYSAVDLISPGPGKARVEVVCDPYPWCAGKNVIVLGGSDLAGVNVAMKHFKAKLSGAGKSRAYSWERWRSDARPVAPGSVKPVANVTFRTFNALAEKYLETTAEVYAEKAFGALEQLCQIYARKERKDFTYAEESTSPTTFYAWDVLEHHPLLQPEQRQRYASLLYSVLLRGLPSHTYEWKDLAKGPKLVWNHTGCPLFGIYVGARYFGKHYPETRSFTSDALVRCKNAFESQMKVWKTREDAHSYYKLGFLTVMGYSAGEWKLDYIENGNLKQMAEYAIATGDNTGGAANFGDAEAIRSNRTEMIILEKAFAWLADPGYLWRLNHISGGTWRNRYHRKVKPLPPEQLAGIAVLPMAKEIYELHNGKEAYGRRSKIPLSEVPLEKSFDKVSFRDSFDPMGQYLLIDGFSSGMHLHYDANMIVRFADRGRVWLMDDDYLVRQTTEHSGLSLLRTGRNTERMPVFTSLEGLGDFERVGLARTRLPNYNGADWTRDIFWRKGHYLLIREELSPGTREPFLVFNILKLYDRGQVAFGSDGALRSIQPEVSVSQPEATLTVLPAMDREASLARRRSVESGIPSVRLIERASVSGVRSVVFRNLLFVSDELKKTRLETRALDTGYLAVRGTTQTRRRLPALSRGKPYHFDVPPTSTYPDTGERLLTDGFQPGDANIKSGWVAWYGQSPTITLDLGREMSVERIGAQVMGGDQWGIKFPTSVQLSAAANDRVFRPVGQFRPSWQENGNRYSRQIVFKTPQLSARYLWLHFECAPGGFIFIGEVWASQGKVLTNPVSERLDALLGSGKLTRPGLEVDADLAYLSPRELAFVGARSCKIEGVALKIHGTGNLLFQDQGDGARLSAAVRRSLHDVFTTGRQGRFRNASSEKIENIAASYPCESGAAAQVWPVDAGTRGFVLGAGKNVVRLNASLEPVWERALPMRVTAVGAGDLDGDGKQEVLAGTENELLYCFDPAGRQQWQWEVQPKLIQWGGWNGKARVEQIRVGDINGDGQQEIVLGTKNSWLLALDHQRNLLWKYGYLFHGCRDIQVADLDGDGHAEVITANRYGSVTRHDGSTGKRLATYTTELGDTFAVLAKRPAGRAPAILSGSTTGVFHAFSVAGKVLWSFNNAGFGAIDAAFNASRVWLGSDSGFLYVLDPSTGALLGSHDFGTAITRVLASRSGPLVLDARGTVWKMNEKLVPQRIASVGARPKQAFIVGTRAVILTRYGLFSVAIP